MGDCNIDKRDNKFNIISKNNKNTTLQKYTNIITSFQRAHRIK